MGLVLDVLDLRYKDISCLNSSINLEFVFKNKILNFLMSKFWIVFFLLHTKKTKQTKQLLKAYLAETWEKSDALTSPFLHAANSWILFSCREIDWGPLARLSFETA